MVKPARRSNWPSILKWLGLSKKANAPYREANPNGACNEIKFEHTCFMLNEISHFLSCTELNYISVRMIGVVKWVELPSSNFMKFLLVL
jgi:hypothetical protein